MKHLTLLLLLVLAYPSYAQKKEMDKEHRFVIIEVENVYKGTSFESVPTNFISSGKDKSIIKLDTQTGDTWLLTFEEDTVNASTGNNGEKYVARKPVWKKIETLK